MNADFDGVCHSALYRLRRKPVAALRPPIWLETVVGAADSPVAARRRAFELTRGLGVPATGPYRIVLLEYADQVVDVVVVALRSVAVEDVLFPFLAGTDPQVAAPGDSGNPAAIASGLAPDWGLGGARPEPGVATDTRVVPFPGMSEPELARVLTAAMEYTAARYAGRELPDTTLGEYRDLVQQGHEVYFEAGSEPALPEDEGELLDYLPALGAPPRLAVWGAQAAGSRLRLRTRYRTDRFAPAVVGRFLDHALRVARLIAAAPGGAPLRDLDLLDEAETIRIRRLGGMGNRVSAPATTIHGLFERRAREQADQIAVSCEETSLTYRELDERADRLAAALRRLGAGPGTRVGVCLERSADVVVVLLAVLKSGSAYVPFDPHHPVDRMAFMLQDSAPILVVGDAEHLPDPCPAPRYGLADLDAAPRTDDLGRARGADPEDPAYVIYTSGSTGRPKGVVIPHRNVISLLTATAPGFGLGAADVWTFFHSAAFDFSVWEIWGCLLTGGRLVVVPYWVSRTPEDFHRLLHEQRVTVLSQTPSAFTQLSRTDARQEGGPAADLALRLVVLGGEPLDAKVLRPWLDRHLTSACRLVNMFGITETTVHVTSYDVTRADTLTGSHVVGKALPGWCVYVADPEGRVLPPGIAGEILVGGAGVAAAYLDRPALTADRFRPDPATGARVYRSGDLGRLLPDGRLEHLGRLDSQVQLRGFRIELDEVRSVLLADPSVLEAAVVLAKEGTDQARIDAYVILDEPADASERGPSRVAGIRRRIIRFLPEYMVPSTITVLSELPLTVNGKLDSARLPAADAVIPAARSSAGSGTLLAVWHEVFGAPVGPDDDFFELGGNSLLAVRLLTAVRERGLPSLSVRDLYRNPTARRLGQALAAHGRDQQEPLARPRRGRFLDVS